ncbi:MAG: hypothetical protein J5I90_09425 [Caldilineales bacterium]|nr:hypothetical protein [Caldilineales bacterium]
MTSAVLVATLGSEPQIIPLAIQLLARADYLVDEAIVVHTDAKLTPVAASLSDLRSAFALHPEWPALTSVQVDIPDLLDDKEHLAFADAIYHLLRGRLARHQQVHMLLAGGRKSMALLGMAIAQILFSPDDHVWYLYSDERLRQSGRMNLQPDDDARLVSIPLMRWSLAPPILTELATANSPLEAYTWHAQQTLIRKRNFWEAELTPAEREVAETVVRTGATDVEISQMLHKSQRTISHQLVTIYSKLRLFLGVRDDVRVDRYTLISQFAQLFPPIPRE